MEGHIRISFAGSVKDVTEGMERIRWALDPTSPNEIYIGDKKAVRDWSKSVCSFGVDAQGAFPKQ